MSEISESFECRSSMVTDRTSIEIKWAIERELIEALYKENHGSRKSFVFNSKFHGSSWQLKLIYTLQNPNDLQPCVVLTKADIDRSKFQINYNFILRANDKLIASDKTTKNDTWHSVPETGIGHRSWITKQDLEGDKYWQDNFLRLVCRIKVKIIDAEVTVPSSYNTLSPPTLKPLDLGKILQSGQMADMMIGDGKKLFSVHKCVLVARCPYFEAMFQSGSLATKDVQIIIEDIELEILEVILNFIYTNKLPTDLKPIAKKLLIAADKFDMLPLVSICQHQLCQDINLSNCIEMLIFADTYVQPFLKDSAILFIRKNLRQVVSIDAWKELERQKFQLLIDVLETKIETNIFLN